ncbi:MAG: VOC family protein [Pseudomonadales bacterium]
MVKPIQLAHFVFQTRRFPEMLKWYQDVLEADVRFQNPLLAFLSFDEEHHRIALIDLCAVDPDAEQKLSSASGTVEHVAFTYASIADLLENYARLKKMGIEPHWCVHHGMTISMYYGDPDGNHIELQVDTFDTADQANEFMLGEAFTKNPIGVDYDPDELLEKLRNGADAATLLQYHEGPASTPQQSANR